MKKLLLLTKTLLAVALLCVGQNAWGKAVTMRSWTFTGLGSDTELTASGSISLTESSTTCYLGTAPSCCEGLYFQGKWKVYSGTGTNSGIRNIDSGDRMIIVPNLKKDDIITITGNDDAINNINTTKYTGTKDEVNKTLTFTMSADGNFYFKMVKSQTVYPAIKSIVVTHNYGNVYSADFEDAGTYANGWTIHSDLGPSQGTCTATSSKTLYMINGKSSNRAFSYAYSDAIITNASENNYIYEFDFNYGQCNKNATSSTLTIQSNNSAKKLFTIDKQSVAWSGAFKISNSSGTVLTETALAGGPYNNSTFPSLYHFMVEGIQDDGVYLTVTSGSSISLARTKVADFAPVTGLYSNMGKNMTAVAFDNIAYNIEIEGAKVRATAAIEAYNNIKNELMNSTAYSTLTSAYTTIAAYSTDEAIVADISGYITAIEALESANVNAVTSADNFAILNELIANANSFATTVTEYIAPSGAATVYTENADVDPVSLATAVRNEIARAGAQHGNNTDISAIIVNKGFEMGSILGWNVDGNPATGGSDIDNNGGLVTTGDGNLISGTYTYYTGWNGRNINQTISGLPAGNYKLTAKAKSWTNGEWRCTIALVANGGASTPVSMEGGNTDLEYEFTVLGSETSINIGIAGTNGASSPYPTGGTWGYFCDDFTLTYVGQDPVAQAKASLEAEIETATALKDSWTPKVGTTPFKYDATYYNALVIQITSSNTVLNSGSETVSDYTSAESALETAEGNMASSTQNQPDADKYYRLYLANGGTSTGKNLNLLKGSTYWLSISDTPYPVKFVASGSYYTIRDAYGNYIGAGSNNFDWGTMSSGEKSNSAKWDITLQDDGTVIMYNQNSSFKSWGWRLGTKALTDNSQVSCYYSDKSSPSNVKWIISDEVTMTDVNLAVNATTGWGTFIAPYDNLTPSTVKAYTVSHKNGNIVYFEENETGVLSANTPYILSTEESSNVAVAFKGIANNDENTYEVNGLVGLLAAETVPANSYILQYQAGKVGTAFYKLASNMTGTAYRCYLDLDNVPVTPVVTPARTIRMSIFGGITGVDNVEAAAEVKAQDGKFIENGKIVIVKNGKKFNANGQQVK